MLFQETCANSDTKLALLEAIKTQETKISAVALFPGNIDKEKQKWADLSLQHLETDDGPVVLVWFIDITEQKSKVSKMIGSIHQAETMNEMKSDFLATMSHEIRTPMQSIYGLLELMSEEALEDDMSVMVNTARRSSTGLLEILDDILDLAKVNAGKMELDYFETPVRTLSSGVIECMQVKLQGKHVNLVENIAENVPPIIMGDPKRLRQILLNLVGNALKFTDHGSITLNVTDKIQRLPPARLQHDEIGIRFEVVDSGMGMPPSVAKKLFTPFTQADTSTTRRFGGTGLGLSICAKLVEIMGGEIGVDSAENVGSTFWFEIPTRTFSQAERLELPDLEGLAVISVEDHPAGAREIHASLKSMGANVVSCASCAEGLDLIKQRPFDVAVLDQGLPDGLGVDLAKDIKKIRPFMGVIIYTVRDDIGLQHSARSLGATYLEKPASRIGLGEAVKSAARQITAQISNRPKRLLIAEDTASVRDVLQRQLKKLGVEADFVETGVQALNTLAKRKHGILFTDLHMPDMDGYELVNRMRGQEENASTSTTDRFPIIALTADVQMARPQAYLSHGFDECLLKPIGLGQLKQLLIRWGLLQENPESFDASAIPPAPPEDVKDETPPISKEDVINQLGAFDETLVDMVEMFIEMTQPLIDSINQSFASGDTEQLGEQAHSLHGAALSACCNDLGHAAAAIEDAVGQEKTISQEQITKVQNEFTRVCAYLETLKHAFST